MKSKRFFKDQGCQVPIDKDNNETFTDLLEAYGYARSKRSYHYQIFDVNGKHAGYAVPR
ncbi:hypothetical protein [Muricauda sp. MAR_2010_75]|uniref:hypothetical protein n=1 Tax=Allomuricauda sp. MAR_2010_75 TaxID=1250232 RepID=UPI0012E0A1B9|nr:hypothetical protein [Muricauda sp. MAR_2010_75]